MMYWIQRRRIVHRLMRGMGAELMTCGSGTRASKLAVVVMGDHVFRVGEVSPSRQEPVDGEGIGGAGGEMVRGHGGRGGRRRASSHQETVVSQV